MTNPENEVIDLTEDREHDGGVPNRRGPLVTTCDLLHNCLKALYSIFQRFFQWTVVYNALWYLILIVAHDWSSYMHTNVCTTDWLKVWNSEGASGVIWHAFSNGPNSPVCTLLLNIQTTTALGSNYFWHLVLVGGLVRLFNRPAERALRN
jgi:hypothetical protein